MDRRARSVRAGLAGWGRHIVEPFRPWDTADVEEASGPPVDSPASIQPRFVRWWRAATQHGKAVIARADRVPALADAVLALVLALVTLPDALAQTPVATSVALHLGLWIPVAFRRRAPCTVFGLLVAVAFLQWLTGVELAADLALVIGLYTVAVHRRRAQAIAAAAVLEVGAVLATISWGHEDGSIRTFVQLSGVVLAALLLGITVRSRARGFALLQERADRLERERDQQALIAATAERTRIAREMHDIVAHSLSVMIALADGASLTERAEDAKTAMRQVSRTGRDALADTRRVLDVLRDDDSAPVRQPPPMLDTLSALLSAVEATGLDTRLHVCGTAFDPTPTAQTAVYRIVQEAVTNTVKHATASRVDVELRYAEPSVQVVITDDGIGGGRPGRVPVNTGHGLVGMRERAALFGGAVLAGPGPGGGWRVTAVLPVTTGPSS